jgi:hypothetical protein
MKHLFFIILMSCGCAIYTPHLQAQAVKDSADIRLCEWAVKEIDPATATKELDRLIADGANINCACELTKTYRNALKAIGNKVRNALSRFFLNRSATPKDEYYTQKEFYTPVHLWVLAEEKKLVEYAVKQYKADLNIAGYGNVYPLEEAVKVKNMEYAKWLVSLGASASLVSLCASDIAFAEWLIGQGCKIENADWGCLISNELVFQHLLKKYKPDLAKAKNFKPSLLRGSLSPATLDIAFEHGGTPDKDLIDYYLNFNSSQVYNYTVVFAKYNADLSECGFFGCPLEHAISANSLPTVKLLVEKGVLSAKKPICTANFDILDFLVSKGFDQSNIQLKCLLDSPEKLKIWLSKYKTDLSKLSGSDDLKQASPPCLEILFAEGIKPKSDLLSHLMTFNTDKSFQYTSIFIKYKQDFQACGFFGCPMQIAIDRDQLNLVKLMVENGADLKQFVKDKVTALEYAKLKNKTLIVNYLIEKEKK